MDFDFQVLKLTEAFYRNYPDSDYPEILKKHDRPYTCLLIDLHYNDYFICLPFRSNIRHKYAFRFKDSLRAKKNKSGLDYTKMLIIKKEEYIGQKEALVDTDEYKEMRRHIIHIANAAVQYLEEYIAHKKGSKPLHPQAYQRKYGRSTLPYFNTELRLSKDSKNTKQNNSY